MLLVCLEVVMPIRDNIVLLDLVGYAYQAKGITMPPIGRPLIDAMLTIRMRSRLSFRYPRMA